MNDEGPRSFFRFSLAGLMGTIFLLAMILALVRAGIFDWWSAAVVGVQILGGAVGGVAGLLLRGQSGFAPGILYGLISTMIVAAMYALWLLFNVRG